MKFRSFISKFDINRHCIVLVKNEVQNFVYSGCYESNNYFIRLMKDSELDYQYWCKIISMGYGDNVISAKI